MEFAIFINIVELVEHLFSRNLNVAENESAVVDTVEANFHAHIFNKNSWHRFHIIASDLNKEAVNSLTFAFNNRLSKNNSPISMASSIGNPVFL
jgi:hypothetical protein